MDTNETARQLRALRYRMAQVEDLQRQRQELATYVTHAAQSVGRALQVAKLDSTLKVARLALAHLLNSLPEAERLRIIRMRVSGAGSRPRHTDTELEGSSATDARSEWPARPAISWSS